MIIKSSNFLYLFDFDGTIVGSDGWIGFFKNIKLSFQKLYINPAQLDIRWCLLTSRPKIDYSIIKLICWYHKLKPRQIFTGPTWTYKFKNKTEEVNYKVSFIKNILNGKVKLNYTDSIIDKICYVDNNLEVVTLMNNQRKDYSFLAITVPDLMTKNLEFILT